MNSSNNPENKGPRGPLRSFGRTGGRPLSKRQKRLRDDLLPTIEIIPTETPSLVPEQLFEDSPDEIWFEIGFGGGEHLIGQAQANPNIGIIGVEPFQEGVGKALSSIDDLKIRNIRIHEGDARHILDSLSAASLDRIFILFPDPWHKVRHHKRRLIQDDFITSLSRVLKPNGKIRFATDWANYADWTLEKFQNSRHFQWTASSPDDWRIPPSDHITTRYQLKKLGDCDPVWLDFTRLS